MTEENYVNPFESHAVSTDEALMLMLGIRGELRHYVDGEIIDIELEDILFDIHEKADVELSNVKFDQNEYESKGGQDPDELNNFSKDRDIKEKQCNKQMI